VELLQVLQTLNIPRPTHNGHPKRLQLHPRPRFSLPLGIGGLLLADGELVNPLRDGLVARLLFRLVVRSGDVGGLVYIPVGLELHRLYRCAMQECEEGGRAEGWGC
jgi:hypothetical protein